MNKHKFEIISALDKIRWGHNCEHLIDINYAHEMNPAEKILTHWLCYITDRQMPYQIIWDVGGFVFSDLIKQYESGVSVECLLNPSSENSFFKGNDKEGYSFISSERGDSKDTILKRYKNYLNDKKQVVFKPRFYPIDFFSIYFTLSILSTNYNRSIIEYFSRIIKAVYSRDKEVKAKDYIESLAKGLDYLSFDQLSTYTKSNQKYLIKASEDSKKENANKGGVKDCINELLKYIKLNEIELSQAEQNITYVTLKARSDDIKAWIKNGCAVKLTSNERYGSFKRIWCSLRDYIKSPIFSEPFKLALKEYLEEDVWKSFNEEVLEDNGNRGCRYIELPGDVWNENTIFRQCFSEQTKGKFGKQLRKDCGWNEDSTWYPEQFDITFSIAPRMCEQNNCSVCLLSDIPDDNDEKKKRENRLLELCSEKEETICPIVLLHCGFRYKCQGSGNCTLRKLIELK